MLYFLRIILFLLLAVPLASHSADPIKRPTSWRGVPFGVKYDSALVLIDSLFDHTLIIIPSNAIEDTLKQNLQERTSAALLSIDYPQKRAIAVANDIYSKVRIGENTFTVKFSFNPDNHELWEITYPCDDIGSSSFSKENLFFKDAYYALESKFGIPDSEVDGSLYWEWKYGKEDTFIVVLQKYKALATVNYIWKNIDVYLSEKKAQKNKDDY